MLTKKLTHIVLCALCLACCNSVAAQNRQPQSASRQDSLLLRNYAFVKQQDAWLATLNAAALTRFAASNIAEAQLSAIKASGGLVDHNGSSNSLQMDGSVEAFYRLGRRTVVFGGIGYDNFSGKDMTGSVFTSHTGMLMAYQPAADVWATAQRRPFDIVEDSLTNPGRKHCDTYRLFGAVGVDVYNGISLGASMHYTAANYAKYKDLRHKNKLMDLTLTVGAYAPVTTWLSAGADYIYHRTTESVDFATYGKSDRVFKSLIDYGTFYGIVEQFGNEGYTDKSREMPLFEDSHGASFQVGVQPVDGLSALGSIAFSRGTGYYGRKSPYTITYTNHRRDRMETALSLSYRSESAQHRLDLCYANEKLANKAETYRELTNENGAYYYEYYDPVETGDKQWDDIRLAYTALLDINGEQPAWEFAATYHFGERRQASYLYPYYRHQHLKSHAFGVQATRRLFADRGVWALTASGGYMRGSGSPYDDYTFVKPSDMQEQPATMEAHLMREYHYLTAPRYTLGAAARYDFLIPDYNVRPNARIGIDYQKATERNEFCRGTHRVQLMVAVGCTF